MLAVGVCAQITALLLTATDELCSLVSGVAGDAAPAFLTRAGTAILDLSVASRSPFLAFVIAVFTVAGAVILWLELMMREAAVYVVVAMLPLAFAAFVWPARRMWALRAMELLSALILAKLAMVVVLTLGGAALEQAPSVAGFLAGLVLLVLGVFAPWAMLRMIPLTELASGAAGRLRAESVVIPVPEALAANAGKVAHWAASASGRMRGDGEPSGGGPRDAAQSLIARIAADRPVAEEADTPSSGGSDGALAAVGAGAGADAGAASGDLSGADAETGAEPDRHDDAPSAGDDSMINAPDNSWRTLKLSARPRGTPSHCGPPPRPQPRPTPASRRRVPSRRRRARSPARGPRSHARRPRTRHPRRPGTRARRPRLPPRRARPRRPRGRDLAAPEDGER